MEKYLLGLSPLIHLGQDDDWNEPLIRRRKPKAATING